jgi:hypothetical protein
VNKSTTLSTTLRATRTRFGSRYETPNKKTAILGGEINELNENIVRASQTRSRVVATQKVFQKVSVLPNVDTGDQRTSSGADRSCYL